MIFCLKLIIGIIFLIKGIRIFFDGGDWFFFWFFVFLFFLFFEGKLFLIILEIIGVFVEIFLIFNKLFFVKIILIILLIVFLFNWLIIVKLIKFGI